MTGKYRVGVVGSGGVGKSGLAEQVAQRLGIRFLRASDVTNPILTRMNFDWSSGTQVEKFLAKEECQDEILLKSIENEHAAGDFVTDRTAIDLAAYAVVELNQNVQKVDDILEACRAHAGTYTHIVFCQWGLKPLVPNNKRTTNPHYQFVVHSVMHTLLTEWCIPFLHLRGTDDSRIDDVMKYV